MKIRLFSGWSEICQDEANLWLQQYEDSITIEKIEYSTCSSGRCGVYHSVMIVFTDKPEIKI